MEQWFLISIALSLCTAVVLKLLLTPKKKLPPGPKPIPFFGNLQLLHIPFFELKPIIRQLHAKYGPIITLHFWTYTHIFISDHSLAQKALVQKGSVFSNRPPGLESNRIITSNQHNINSAEYGPLWRLLRRNLTSEILHSSRIKSYADGRQWVLKILLGRLTHQADSGAHVHVIESFQYAIFCLLLLMCFGQKLDESVVKEIEIIERRLIVSVLGMNVFNFMPRLSKIIFRKRWNEHLQIRRQQEEIFIPFIRARKDQKQEEENDSTSSLFSYVDSLLTLELPDEGGRKLTESEIVSLVSEFLDAGADTTSTLLQWIMANLVKNQRVQEKLVEEIEKIVGKEAEEVREEDLSRVPYLKAVVMEGLRRHPPGHFLLPHTVSEEVMFENYVIPKDAVIFFLVGEMGWDEKVWNDPLEFRPERFSDGREAVDDVTSSKVKMMPFGAGRRICPGLYLAILHVEYFVANMVREFEWKPVEEEGVDLTETMEFTVVMKKPLKAKITRRRSQK